MVTDAVETPVSPGTDAPIATEMESVASQEAVAETAPPPTMPAVAAPPTTISPAPPAIPPEVQQYIARLEQQNAIASSQQEQQVVQSVIAQHAQSLAQRAAGRLGITADEALPFVQEVAAEQITTLYRMYQADRNIRAAIGIARETGVDVNQLIDLPGAGAMRQAAQVLSSTTKQSQEIAALRAQVAKLTKGAVPAQSFAQGAQPGAGAGLTGDALEAAWLKHETTQPGRPNPYDSAYRAMLRG